MKKSKNFWTKKKHDSHSLPLPTTYIGNNVELKSGHHVKLIKNKPEKNEITIKNTILANPINDLQAEKEKLNEFVYKINKKLIKLQKNIEHLLIKIDSKTLEKFMVTIHELIKKIQNTAQVRFLRLSVMDIGDILEVIEEISPKDLNERDIEIEQVVNTLNVLIGSSKHIIQQFNEIVSD